MTHGCHKCQAPPNPNQPYENSPCANCRLTRPQGAIRQAHTISYGPQFEKPSETTWHILEVNHEAMFETFQYWLTVWGELSRMDQQLFTNIAQHPNSTYASIARIMGITRQAVHKRVKRFRVKYPGVLR